MCLPPRGERDPARDGGREAEGVAVERDAARAARGGGGAPRSLRRSEGAARARATRARRAFTRIYAKIGRAIDIARPARFRPRKRNTHARARAPCARACAQAVCTRDRDRKPRNARARAHYAVSRSSKSTSPSSSTPAARRRLQVVRAQAQGGPTVQRVRIRRAAPRDETRARGDGAPHAKRTRRWPRMRCCRRRERGSRVLA